MASVVGFLPYLAGANVLAADEEGETCLHLAFARHSATVNFDHAHAIQQVVCKPLIFLISTIASLNDRISRMGSGVL